VISKPKLPSTVSDAFMNEFPISAPSQHTNISQRTGGLTRLPPSNLPWALLGTGTSRRSRPFHVRRDARTLKAFVLDQANAMTASRHDRQGLRPIFCALPGKRKPLRCSRRLDGDERQIACAVERLTADND
jgi:hypothetical protein